MRKEIFVFGRKIVFLTGRFTNWYNQLCFQNKYSVSRGVRRFELDVFNYYVCLYVYDKLRY